MIAWLRVLLRAALFPAAVGMAVGLWCSAREILPNRYLAQGLWHTALWIAGPEAAAGALAGAGAGLFLSLWCGPRVPAAARRAATVPALAVVLGLALTALPEEGPALGGLPALWVFGGAVVVCWALASAFLLSRLSAESGPAEPAEGVWTLALWLCYLSYLSRLWASLPVGPRLMYFISGGLLAVLLLYAGLRRPLERLVRRVSGRPWGAAAWRQLRRLAAVWLLAGLLLWSGGWALRGSARGRLARARRNVLIIAVDTLREDRVSLLSKPTSGWDLTPNLRARLAPHGTYFREAHASAPWTMPSFASIFTGLYPEAHGAEQGEQRLAPDRLTLAEVMREAGYQTTAVVSGEFVASGANMLQGFDTREESQVSGLNSITSPQVTDRALARLAEQRNEPFFMFVHYFDPHWTYQDHPGFDFTRGLFRAGRLPYKLKTDATATVGRSNEEVRELKARYAEEVAFTDAHIGRLLAYLDQQHLWDSTCVIFVADHGEEFLEHGSFEHGSTLYEEVLHVPLFIADPARTGPISIEAPVETRWLFGAILDMAGLRRPAADADMPDLFAPRGEAAQVRGSLYNPRQTCLLGSRYKLITGLTRQAAGPAATREGDWRARGGRGPRNREVLFDLQTDPGETRDASPAHPEVARRLQAELKAQDEALSRQRSSGQTPQLNRDHLQRLRDLGYL